MQEIRNYNTDYLEESLEMYIDRLINKESLKIITVIPTLYTNRGGSVFLKSATIIVKRA